MNPEDVKHLSINAVNLATEYVKEYVSYIHSRHVYPTKSALARLSDLDESLPQLSSDARLVIKQLYEYAAPTTVATTGGRYFGLVVGGSTPAAMGASMLNAAWDQIAILESSSPAAIHLERIAAKWVLELLSLPDKSSVGFTTGTSVANLVCLAAARNAQYKKLGIDITEVGISGAPPLSIVLSDQAHVTVHKALRLLGFGKNQLIKLPCDKEGRIIPDAISKVGRDTIVCLQAGNVNSGSSDFFDQIIPQVKEAGAWVHVDGAFGLWASASEQKKYLNIGVEHADSWAVDGHKWLNTPYDCGLAICRNAQNVHNVMTTVAPYLTTDSIVPPKDMVPEFSRRARGIEVWAAIKEMGSDGVANLIERCCEHAERLSKGLADIGYVVLNDVRLNQVVATIGTPEQLNDILKLIQGGDVCWFGSTFWKGHHAIRLSVSSWATTDEDIERTLNAIKESTNKVLSK